MAKRVFNFYAGPATLPAEVVEEASHGIREFNDLGMSIVEISHRSKDFDEVINTATADIREILAIPEGYHVLYLQGGASLQFAMIPMNFLGRDETAGYINTGAWSKKAIKEAKLFGNVDVVASSEDKNFSYIPDVHGLRFPAGAAYAHVTSNNTIFGTQYSEFPDTGSIPLVADMSSDMMCRRIDVSKFALIYAGAQKNIGPSGVTMVIMRDDMLKRIKPNLPTMLNYQTHADKDSLFNTPPVYAIYVLGLVMKWVKKVGGLTAVEAMNREKAELIYGAIDTMNDFYRGTADKNSRSWMNVTFRLPSEELEKKFVTEAAARDMIGLKGHRSVGGIRASIYNAHPREGVEALVDFMKEFARRNG